MNFSKELSKFALTLYKVYLEQVESGVSNSTAKRITSSFLGECPLFEEFQKDDISDYLSTLKKEGFIKTDILGSLTLQDSFIAQMESKKLISQKDVISALANVGAISSIFMQ